MSWSHPVEEGEPMLHARPNVGGHHDEVHLSFTDGLAADHEAAVNLWHAANLARGLPPSADRVGRIWEKLAEPQACLVIGHLDSSKGVLAMALAEPGRADHGAGSVIGGYGHVAMVFVHPDMWGRGVGRHLLDRLHERGSQRGWNRLTLWTRESNERARRLYVGQGYHASGQRTTLENGDPIIQLERLHADLWGWAAHPSPRDGE